MKTPRFLCMLPLLAIVAATGASSQTQGSSNDVIGAGGGSSSNAGTRICVTIGQPVVGDVARPGKLLQQGFWHHTAKGNLPENTRVTTGLSLAMRAQPNPFTETTELLVNIPSAGHVTAKLHDAQGRELRTLADQFHQGGEMTISVDGAQLSSGTYVIILTTGKARATTTLRLVK